MPIPPPFLPEELRPLREILRACAAEESALANYAAAEVKKIYAFLARFDDSVPGRRPSDAQGEDMIRSAAAGVRSTRQMQQQIEAAVAVVLERLGLEELYRLKPPPPDCCGRITVCGNGRVKQAGDCYQGAAARLRGEILCRGGCVDDGIIQYAARSAGRRVDFVAAGDAMKLDLPSPPACGHEAKRSVMALLSGWGLASWRRGADCEQDMAWFTLTLWDSGPRSHSDRFRLLLLTPGQPPQICHDSGVIR